MWVKSATLTAVAMAWATTPGSASQVPKPTEGMLAPVFNSKNRRSSPIFFFYSDQNKSQGKVREREREVVKMKKSMEIRKCWRVDGFDMDSLTHARDMHDVVVDHITSTNILSEMGFYIFFQKSWITIFIVSKITSRL